MLLWKVNNFTVNGIGLSQHHRELGTQERSLAVPLVASIELAASSRPPGEKKKTRPTPSVSRPTQDGRVQHHLVVCLRLVRRCATVPRARTREFR